MDQWQRMFYIVNQYPSLLQANLKKNHKKLWLSRLLSENMLVFFFQYTGLLFSTITPYPVPMWFASGSACAFIFLRGYRVLPGIWLGSFLAYAFSDLHWGLSSLCASVYALQAALLLYLGQRYWGLTLVFYRKKPWLQWVISSIAITAVSSLILVFACYSSLSYPIKPASLWLQWWLSNLNGILILACAMLTWDLYFPQIHGIKTLNRWCRIVLSMLLCGLILSLAARVPALLFLTDFFPLFLSVLAISGLFFALKYHGLPLK